MQKGPVRVLLMLVALLVLAFFLVNPDAKTSTSIPVSDFITDVEKGVITQVIIEGDKVTGFDAKNEHGFVTYASDKTELIKVMREHKVTYRENPQSSAMPMVMMFLPLLLGIGLIYFFISRMAKAQGGMAKRTTASKATLHHTSTVTFKDVAGVEEAAAEVGDVVEFLKDPKKSQRLGGRMPKGILLVGPPGCGKTLLARAVAGEAGVAFFSVAASSFVEMFVGVGAGRVRDLFEEGKKHAPCIIFIDEIDAVGKQRGGTGFGGGHDEREQTLNELLNCMDGFTPNDGVIIMAATNRPETLDSALLRPGRFDRQVVVNRPDLKGRVKILAVHFGKLEKQAGKVVLSPDIDLEVIGRTTTGMTGADLELLTNEAALHAAKVGNEFVTMADIEFACDKVRMGPERKSAVIDEDTKKIIAWHECGHTLAAWFNPDCDDVRRVTIVPRGMALGLTWTMPEQDPILMTKNQLLAEISLLYGGRLAEAVVLGENITTGASNDLQRATKLAGKVVKNYGMCEENGDAPQVYGDVQEGFVYSTNQRDYSDATEAMLDKRKKAVLKSCYDKTKQLLADKREQLETLVAALLEKETLVQEEIALILGERVKRAPLAH